MLLAGYGLGANSRPPSVRGQFFDAEGILVAEREMEVIERGQGDRDGFERLTARLDSSGVPPGRHLLVVTAQDPTDGTRATSWSRVVVSSS